MSNKKDFIKFKEIQRDLNLDLDQIAKIGGFKKKSLQVTMRENSENLPRWISIVNEVYDRTKNQNKTK
jgi:hypothetical protein